VNHQELLRRKRHEKKMACEVLDKECRRIECLKKGIFAHSSEKPDNHRRYLKQANFLFTRVLTRRMRENAWQCQWCPRTAMDSRSGNQIIGKDQEHRSHHQLPMSRDRLHIYWKTGTCHIHTSPGGT